MAVEIAEVACFAKSGDEDLNEDGYAITDTLIAVFDGATDKDGNSSPTPGRQATQALISTAKTFCDTHIDNAETLVKSLHESLATLPKSKSEPVAVGAIVHAPTRCIIRVGDISVGINGVFDTPHKKIDEIASAARAALLSALLAKGTDVETLRATDPGRQMILPLLRESRQWRNREDSPYGFAVLDGHGTPASLIDVFEVPPNSEVVLATDGYPCPQPTLAASEKKLAKSLRTDPLQIGPPPGTKGIQPNHKSFDDRTYIRLRL